MQNITIVSPFRDSGHAGILRYITQIGRLDWPTYQLRIVCVEGDSRDHTRNLLAQWANRDKRVEVWHCDTGKPRFKSVVSRERFEVLARVFNMGLDAVETTWSDGVLFLPSDIEYDADMLKRLVARDVDVVAPLVWQNGLFYDIWAFSKLGGAGLGNFPASKIEDRNSLWEMETVGGVILSKVDVIKAGVRYTDFSVDRGYCDTARAYGFRVWADPGVDVFHGRRPE